MDQIELKRRTKAFALRVIRVAEAMPKTRTADIIGRQLVRCGTSVGANYRAVCRARSTADFLSKMGIVEEEADECAYWLEVLSDLELVKSARLAALRRECDEIIAIVVAGIRTARRKSAATKRKQSRLAAASN